MEGILGINREGRELTITPCLPPQWPGYEAIINVENTRYTVSVEQSAGHADYAVRASLDGVDMDNDAASNTVRVPLDEGTHQLRVTIEACAESAEIKPA